MQDEAAGAVPADDIRGDAPAREGGAVAVGAALDAGALPASDLNAALPHLRRPFAPEAIKFKVQTVFGSAASGCVIVSYIDARLVVERLNAVCGGAWTAEYRATSDAKLMLCDLKVFGVTRTDIGQSSKGLSKDLISDALKRSAVMFGVGVSVYALAQVTLYANDAQGRIKPKKIGGKDSLVLTDQGHEWLRGGYRRWLEGRGRQAFGQELDHGDVLPETIDPDAEAALEGEDVFVPPVPERLEGPEADALIAEAREVYGGFSDEQKRNTPPAMFDEWLRTSWHSKDGLERLVGYLRDRAGAQGGGA